MLTIWGRKSSFNVQKVMWLVGELGLEHRHIEAGGQFGGLDTPEFRALNPHGKVPVIDDSGFVVWESHAILRYLAARYGEGRFWRTAPAERSLSDRWMDWAHTTLQPDFLGGVFWGFYRTPELQRDLPAIRSKVEACARHFQLLDRELMGRDYMLGDALTLADVPLGTHLYRYLNIDIERPRVPNVEAWYRRLEERPAYRQHVMVPFEDLYGRLDF
ncbi:glutathione S-transferase family protein [Pseudolabrys sp. FHR47]|uniref:glutathione S-transferase family protein n=1 Tax=Pseudolabrys sp. FHR47 TaxID=2562284 RepID=UPI0010BE85AC|nr:glutathione S-transferase [Pseudolabrys sp. FHR47]